MGPVGDPILQSNRTRRVDYALFMVEALENDELIHETPATVGCRTPSALAITVAAGPGHEVPPLSVVYIATRGFLNNCLAGESRTRPAVPSAVPYVGD